MYFQYDNKGVPLGFVLNGTQYFYITNQMGDVVAITESNGDIIGEYVYDEWGYILSENTMDPDTDPEPVKAVEMNPIRYRGYCYDRETGYYYLQSRYYDPSICRFINADIPEIAQMSKDITAGTNLFAYCNNEPVNNLDYNGMWVQYVAGGALGGLISLVLYFVDCRLNRQKVVWWKAAGTFFTGAASGVLAATGVKLFGQVIGNVVASLASLVFNSTPITKQNVVIEVITAIIVGIVSGFAGGAGIGHKNYLNYYTKNLIKRIARETAKSITYFVKMTKTIYIKLFSAIIRSIIAGAVTKYGKQLIVR